MKENVSSQLVAECAQKESDMMKVERIEHSAGNNSRTEALSHGQAATLRLARSELPQKSIRPQESNRNARERSPLMKSLISRGGSVGPHSRCCRSL
jgi:hypothetical protein